MVEILPNWHPIFVHFTIALLSVSAILFVTARLFAEKNWAITLEKTAYINLLIGTVITVGTVIAGFYAYNTVSHDNPSHLAMISHRNWALATSSLFILLTLWAVRSFRHSKRPSTLFLAIILTASVALSITGYKGGELVYRHGLGVLSLPNMEEHNHSEKDGHDHHDHDDHHH